MKVNNLFKKVGSVMTTVALLGTLGTTAFADELPTVGVAGGDIRITSVNTKLKDNSTNVYDVTVGYETTAANAVGMTLLVYKDKNNDDLVLDETDKDKNAYQGTTEGTTTKPMQIIGIDQQEKKDGSASAATGSFTFSVTTDKTNAGDYYIEKGKKALIAVSGDQCTPAYATFVLNQTVNKATLTLSNTVSDTFEIAANEDVVTALNAEAKKDSAKLYNDTVDIGKLVSLSDVVNLKWEESKTESGKWTGTGTIPKETVNAVEGVEASADIPVTITANVTITAVAATKVKSIGGVSASTDGKFALTYSPTDTTTPVTKDAITGFLEKQKIVVTDSTGTVDSAEIAITKEMLTEPVDEIADKTEDYTVEYGVKIPSGTTSGKDLLNINSDITANIEVTVTKKTIVTGIELKGDPITVTVIRGTDDTATIDSIKSELEKAINGYTYKVTLSKGDPIENVAIGDASTREWTVAKGTDGSYTATLTVKSITDKNVTAEMPKDGISNVKLPEIKLNVTEGVLGDVNGDGVFNMDDAIYLFNNYMAPELYPISSGKKTDYDRNGIFNMDDAIYLFNSYMAPELYPIS